MEILKFMHVCIAVPDLDKALDFYVNTLGMKSDFQTTRRTVSCWASIRRRSTSAPITSLRRARTP